jgi:hypothetical protein
LTCPDPSRRYIGKVGKFETRFKEHVIPFENKNNYLKIAQNLLNNGHTIDCIEI